MDFIYSINQQVEYRFQLICKYFCKIICKYKTYMYICIPNQTKMKSNRIVQVDENEEFKKTFFYKGDDKRISPIAKHPGISAMATAIERGKALIASGNQLIDNSKKLLA